MNQPLTEVFDEAYYMDGIRSGKSNYLDYKWLPELTIPACQKVADYLGARPMESILDVGCARGFAVKAWRQLGYRAFGYDISQWAIANCDPAVRSWVSNTFPKRSFDWATLKDCAEHIPHDELRLMVIELSERISKGMLFIVPLAEKKGGRYVRDEDEMDKTHINRWTLEDWIEFLEDNAPDFNVNASYNIHGIKPAASITRHSCGFFTLIRP